MPRYPSAHPTEPSDYVGRWLRALESPSASASAPDTPDSAISNAEVLAIAAAVSELLESAFDPAAPVTPGTTLPIFAAGLRIYGQDSADAAAATGFFMLTSGKSPVLEARTAAGRIHRGRDVDSEPLHRFWVQ
jgi:hypothetical protein